MLQVAFYFYKRQEWKEKKNTFSLIFYGLFPSPRAFHLKKNETESRRKQERDGRWKMKKMFIGFHFLDLDIYTRLQRNKCVFLLMDKIHTWCKRIFIRLLRVGVGKNWGGSKCTCTRHFNPECMCFFAINLRTSDKKFTKFCREKRH